MSRITHFSEIDTVISDASLGPDIQEKLRSLGCNVILV
jgi:DeoR/GlpR family transcriptional regulator of sugar metabolism